jgi:hypothetical protein
VTSSRLTGRRAAGTAALLAAIAATQAGATAPRIATESAVFVERVQPGNVRHLEPAERLSRGERVVTIVSWYRLSEGGGPDGSFIITNPMPRAIAFQDSAREDAEVSVDGGRNWGKLGILRIGARLASPEDVTHLRWRIAPGHAAQGSGHIAYSGIVR